MEAPPVTHFGFTQPVNYLGQIHKQNDANVISSHKEVCKQLDVCQMIIREEYEQKGQERLSKSSSFSKQLSQKVAQQLQKYQRERNNIHCIRKENKLASPKTSECSMYQRKGILYSKQTPMITLLSYINLKRRNRRLRRLRQIRHVNTLNHISQLSTTKHKSEQIFKSVPAKNFTENKKNSL
ncbi:unnamed protein product [Rhizophagus irregularis]|nr:unnamed protein product [Rhizophagus irregularis]